MDSHFEQQIRAVVGTRIKFEFGLDGASGSEHDECLKDAMCRVSSMMENSEDGLYYVQVQDEWDCDDDTVADFYPFLTLSKMGGWAVDDGCEKRLKGIAEELVAALVKEGGLY